MLSSVLSLRQLVSPVTRCEVAHVNRDYIRIGKINPQELVTITDITEVVAGQIEHTRKRIDQALRVAASDTMPDPAPERARLQSYGEWLEIREKLDPSLSQDSIHRLPFMNAEKASALMEVGITTIDAIEDPTVLSKSTRRYLSALIQGTHTVKKDALDSFLREIAYPGLLLRL